VMPDLGERQATAVAPNVLDRTFDGEAQVMVKFIEAQVMVKFISPLGAP
jgi:uncharacterized protein (DUF2164 family)